MNENNEQTETKFRGFDAPYSNFVRLPNQFFDELLPLLESEAETKVLLVAIRQTWGWQRSEAELGIALLVEKTGLKEDAVRRGIARCIKLGTIELALPHTPNSAAQYRVVMAENTGGLSSPPRESRPREIPPSPGGYNKTSQDEKNGAGKGADASVKKGRNNPAAFGETGPLKKVLKKSTIYTPSSKPKRRGGPPPNGNANQIPLDPTERAAFIAHQRAVEELQEALMELTQQRSRKLSKSFQATAEELLERHSATAEEVAAFGQWFAQSWLSRGGKGRPLGSVLPTISQIEPNWTKAKAEMRGTGGANADGVVVLSRSGFGG